MGRFNVSEILLLLIAAMLLFGAKRLPDIARSFGKSIQEFKKGFSDHGESPAKPAEPTATVETLNPPKVG